MKVRTQLLLLMKTNSRLTRAQLHGIPKSEANIFRVEGFLP